MSTNIDMSESPIVYLIQETKNDLEKATVRHLNIEM